ncbi:unnamed protein product [Protopolystoma xenopodis]|uniref:EGF-like domain-containing protein n=1 Tax=Protopolystoma xenopodis TaxID=117903 RepID=A0A3S5FBL9_9PLAT|nr:unnamed protein product [Protopolystoma xenopodis]
MMGGYIDECESGSANCRANEHCINAPGSYRCEPVCPQGYTVAGQPSASGRVECVDIDECQQSQTRAKCPHGSRCVNEPGGYSCRCLSTGQEPIHGACLGEFSLAVSGCPKPGPYPGIHDSPKWGPTRRL